MLKKIPKIITIIFLVVFLFQLIGLIFILTTPEISQADITKPKLQIDIGNLNEKFSTVDDSGNTISVPWIGEYISAVYKYAVGVVGILATVVMMFGGVLWITAGGNQERIGNAKSWITASLTGLVLTLCSYLILNTVNPDLIKMRPITISLVEKLPDEDEIVGCCQKIKNNNTGGNTTEYNCESGWEGEKKEWDVNTNKCKDAIVGCCLHKNSSWQASYCEEVYGEKSCKKLLNGWISSEYTSKLLGTKTNKCIDSINPIFHVEKKCIKINGYEGKNDECEYE